MIKVYKIVHGLYDRKVSPSFVLRTDELWGAITCIRKEKESVKEMFIQRVVNPRNSLPTEVINAPSVNAFKYHPDKFWNNHDIVYDYQLKLQIFSRPGSNRYNEVYSNLTIED